MSENNSSLGNIYLSHHAIATIIFQSTLESYGIVGLADRNVIRGISKILFNDPTSGVLINFNGDSIEIDILIIIEYGTRISSVSNSVSQNVRFQVEKMTGIPVSTVNVHVRGLRVSNAD